MVTTQTSDLKLIYLCMYNFKGSVIDSASNLNEYQGYLLEEKGNRCVELKTLPPLCAQCLEILEASNSPNPNSFSSPV
jgi:hypothetical protein